MFKRQTKAWDVCQRKEVFSFYRCIMTSNACILMFWNMEIHRILDHCCHQVEQFLLSLSGVLKKLAFTSLASSWNGSRLDLFLRNYQKKKKKSLSILQSCWLKVMPLMPHMLLVQRSLSSSTVQSGFGQDISSAYDRMWVKRKMMCHQQ